MAAANSFEISGKIVDPVQRKIFSGTVHVKDGKIASVEEKENDQTNVILPGFIDAHVHIESSLLIPSEFARLSSPHGTVGTVSDPHEIGNVLGMTGVRYMIENGKKTPFHFYFGAPSCVPATSFETAGSVIGAQEIDELFSQDGLVYLSEMMNYPGVLNKDAQVMEKIAIAKKHKKPIDGHAPGLQGQLALDYIAAGISTDHECFTLQEALDKIKGGMKILIREGSAAKNYEALHTLIQSHPDKVMFCSDDKHPHELVKGHINELVKRSLFEKKYPLFDVLRAACCHPVWHYNLDIGLLQPGDPADFIVIDSLEKFNVLKTYLKGVLVAENGKTLLKSVTASSPNFFNTSKKNKSDFYVKAQTPLIKVIIAEDGQLVTKAETAKAFVQDGEVLSDPSNDILKLAVINRYQDVKPALGFIKGFGLKKGAIASCIAHDSHNIIAVGVNDEDLCLAINAVIQNKGGIALSDDGKTQSLPLSVAGLMSVEDGFHVAKKYEEMEAITKKLGSCLHDPFMTLSFMALLVIPELKLSDKGLFDGKDFAFTELFSK